MPSYYRFIKVLTLLCGKTNVSCSISFHFTVNFHYRHVKVKVLQPLTIPSLHNLPSHVTQRDRTVSGRRQRFLCSRFVKCRRKNVRSQTYDLLVIGRMLLRCVILAPWCYTRGCPYKWCVYVICLHVSYANNIQVKFNSRCHNEQVKANFLNLWEIHHCIICLVMLCSETDMLWWKATFPQFLFCNY